MEEKNNILAAVYLLVLELKKDPLYIEYLVNSNDMKNNQELLDLIKKYKFQQRIITKELNKEKKELFEKELLFLKDELNRYPLYIRHTYLLEKLENKFILIEDILNAYFKEITNSLK
ncbi:MAG: hypothetical protein RSE91_02445 [Bacilli bacterium]